MTLQPADAATGPRRLALILNQQAGRLLADAKLAEALRTHLRQSATLLEIPAGTLPDRVRAARAANADAIIVAGGDGTVACACQALAGTRTIMGIIPLGTMNLLARDLGMPVDDIAAAADAIAAAVPRAIDTGRVGDHVFACACMLGAPARIGHHREAARTRGNTPLAWVRVVRAAWRTLRRHPPLRLTVWIDGVAHPLRTRALTITVNALDTTPARPFGRSVLDAGRLWVYAERVRSPWAALRLLLHVATGSVRDPALLQLGGSRVEVHTGTPALRILIDGEPHLLPTPLAFEICPASVVVLAAT